MKFFDIIPLNKRKFNKVEIKQLGIRQAVVVNTKRNGRIK